MDGFVQALKNFATETSSTLDYISKEVVIDIGVRVIRITPVKTGRLKGNWQMTVGAPSNKSLVRYDPTGVETIDDLKSKVNMFSAGEVAYIVNNLTYARYIEEGGSRKLPPSGMVGTTAAEFLQIVEDVIRRRKLG